MFTPQVTEFHKSDSSTVTESCKIFMQIESSTKLFLKYTTESVRNDPELILEGTSELVRFLL